MTLRMLTRLKIINLLTFANSNLLQAAVLLHDNDGGNDRKDDDIGDADDICDISNLLQAAVLLLDQPRAAAFLLKASPSRSAVLALLDKYQILIFIQIRY